MPRRLPPTRRRCKAPLRGALVVGAAVRGRRSPSASRAIAAEASAGRAPAARAARGGGPPPPERLAIDYGDAAELADARGEGPEGARERRARRRGRRCAPRASSAARARPPKVAFLYTGQGSQYVNMLQTLRAAEPIVADDLRAKPTA